MPVRLTRFERTMTFGAFMLLAGALVGGAYVLTDDEPKAAVAMAPLAPLRENTTSSAIQSPKLPEIVYASSEVQEPSNDWAWQAWPHSPRIAELDLTKTPIETPIATAAPETPPAKIAPPPPVISPAKPVVTLAASIKPQETALPVQPPPYVVNVAASKVIHMYTAEDGDAACWYELKLEEPQVEILRSAALKLADKSHADFEELDHLSGAAPSPTITLAWWRPDELADVNLVTVADHNHCQWWIAVSQQTGRVFLYTKKPVLFVSN
ncbi:hypothetical protein BH10PLA1_BH10PLA1_17900 [soil metagenome]